MVVMPARGADNNLRWNTLAPIFIFEALGTNRTVHDLAVRVINKFWRVAWNLWQVFHSFLTARLAGILYPTYQPYAYDQCP